MVVRDGTLAAVPKAGAPSFVLKQLIDRVLRGAGVTSPAARAAAFDGTDQRAFLETVRQNAYRVTDADVAGLELPDDEIFELTVAAALGVSQRRLEAARKAIDEVG
jgi:hypothetical protein